MSHPIPSQDPTEKMLPEDIEQDDDGIDLDNDVKHILETHLS